MKSKIFLIIVSIILLNLKPISVNAQYTIPNIIGTNNNCVNIENNLSMGMIDEDSGGEVSKLQEFLYNSGYYSHHAIGIFGWLTFYAVTDFQKDNNLPASGFVGPLTRSAINKLTCSNENTDQTTTQNNTENIVEPTSTISQYSTSTATILTSATTTKTLPYKTDLFKTDDWQDVWGQISTTSEGRLIVNSEASTTGAETLLNGSFDWTNYKYTVNVSITNGDVTLIGGYKDDKNYFTCSFRGQWVGIGGYVNGQQKSYGSTSINSIPSTQVVTKNMTVGMIVKGNTVGCTALGETPNVSYTTTDTASIQGGVGVETWSSTPDSAKMEIRSVSVEPI